MIDVLEIQHTGDHDLEMAQQNIKRFVKVIEDNPVLDGRLIEDIEVPAATGPGAPGTLTVEHKLDRNPRGWFVTDTDAFLFLYRTAWDDKTIDFANDAANAGTVDMWVF